jgi:hypothetical protein
MASRHTAEHRVASIGKPAQNGRLVCSRRAALILFELARYIATRSAPAGSSDYMHRRIDKSDPKRFEGRVGTVHVKRVSSFPRRQEAAQTFWEYAALAITLRRRRIVLVTKIPHFNDRSATSRALAVAHVDGRIRTFENDDLVEHVIKQEADQTG